MKKEVITRQQTVSIVILFITGSSLILGISHNARQDSWIGFLIAFAAMLPTIYIYSRLMGRYPGKDVFEICIEVFGPVVGRIVIALLAWYAIHLGALVLRNFSEFIQVTTFDMMPQTISLVSLVFLVIWATRQGVEVLGRCSIVMAPVMIIMVVITVLFLIKDMNVENLLPVGENLAAVPEDALIDFTFPLAEIVLLLGILNSNQGDGKIGRPLLGGLAIGAAIISIGGFLRNTLVLGFPLENDINFTSFSTVGIAIVGGFLSRIEGIVTANLLMAGFVKVCVCLLAASKGLARLINVEDYRPFAAPLGLVMVALASILYQYSIEMFAFVDVYKYYALPFQLFIPVALAIGAEIKVLIKERKQKKAA